VFEELIVHIDKIAIPDCVFAPNVCQWVGASLLMSLGQDVDRFLLTVEQYTAEGLKDRFGDAFLTFNRQGVYFNKNWELNFKR
jgi:hypothetical protein